MRSDYRIGQAIEVVYNGEWYQAHVRTVHPSGCLDADWGDGTYACGLLLSEVRAMERTRSPSPPPTHTREALLLTSPIRMEPQLGLDPALLHPAPLQYVVDPTYTSSLFKTLSLKCGVFPPGAIPARDLLWFFRSKGEEEMAVRVFFDAVHPLFPEGHEVDVDDPTVSPRREARGDVTLDRFACFYGHCEERVQDWLDEVVFGPEYLKKLEAARARGPYAAMRHSANLRLVPRKEDPIMPTTLTTLSPPAPLRVEVEEELAPPLQYEEEVAEVDARVNLSGSPHRTRLEAAEARLDASFGMEPPPSPRDMVRQEVHERRFPSPSRSPSPQRQQLPHHSQREVSPHSSPLLPLRGNVRSGSAVSNGRVRSTRSNSVTMPTRLTVSGVLRKGFKCDLNGVYNKMTRNGAHDVEEDVVLRYRKSGGGGAILYKTVDGRWRLNDSSAAVGWVYSHHTLLGQWEMDLGAGDYTGAQGTPYPTVAVASAVNSSNSNNTSRGRTSSRGAVGHANATPPATFAKPKPGLGIMSSGSPRMVQRYQASTDALYGPTSGFTKPRVKSVGRRTGSAKSVGKRSRYKIKKKKKN